MKVTRTGEISRSEHMVPETKDFYHLDGLGVGSVALPSMAHTFCGGSLRVAGNAHIVLLCSKWVNQCEDRSRLRDVRCS